MAHTIRPVANYKRPRAFEDNVYKWNFLDQDTERSNAETRIELESAVFVVHGMGRQLWADTASVLRSGVEDAIESILLETFNDEQTANSALIENAPPFIQDGYWADYDDIEKTFPEVWTRLSATQQPFFKTLFTTRTKSMVRAVLWLLKHQIRLIHPFSVRGRKLYAWMIYVLFQIPALVALPFVAIKARHFLTDILNDVRLYISPCGSTERAIIQRIDNRIGRQFLRLLGLNWDFQDLPHADHVMRDGVPVVFRKVVWIAHSLGSVVSYNVLSDLWARSSEILAGDHSTNEYANAQRFRKSLQVFVTFGSPLDKIAYLFGQDALRPWKPFEENIGPEDSAIHPPPPWYNFYHILDPISGGLDHPLIAAADSEYPKNIHAGSFFHVPFFAHTKYWTDRLLMKFVLSNMSPQIRWDMETDEKERRPMYKVAAMGIWLLAALLCGAAVCALVWYWLR